VLLLRNGEQVGLGIRRRRCQVAPWQDPADGGGAPLVGVGDDQLDLGKAAVDHLAEELGPNVSFSELPMSTPKDLTVAFGGSRWRSLRPWETIWSCLRTCT
jgi:hypothetical protein